MLLCVDVVCFALLSFLVIRAKCGPHDMKFQQSDYQIKFEWAEIVRYNKHLVNFFDGRAFKYNRTCTAVNFTIEYNVPVGNDMEIIIQAYKFASNEYRSFPIRFEVNFCYALRKNYVGGRRLCNCGNFSGCPLTKGIRYNVCNWIPDASQFPPFIPSGRYKIEGQALYHDEELYVINAYGEVSRPILGK